MFQNLDIDTKNQDQRVLFVTYRKTLYFSTLNEEQFKSKNDTVLEKNSFVISGSVRGQTFTNLTDPIETTYKPLKEGVEETTACVFWSFTKQSGLGDWSPVGCSYQGIEKGVVKCHCTHLTNFAILMVRI